ncbi:MAG: hydroxymyristoyl-ACP dehydratase [Planctomycetota bacterium]
MSSLAAEAAACLGEVRRAGEALEAELRFPADLAALAGHFPGHPVVPGVYLLEAAAAAAARAVGAQAWELAAVPVAKFVSPVPLDGPALLRGALREGGGSLELEAEVRVGEQVAASFRLVLRRGA